MRVLFASSEVFPLIKTGGLADVSGALPAALAAAGTDIRLLMPGYPVAMDGVTGKRRVADLGDSLGVGSPASLVSGKMPGTNLPVWLIDCPALYDRPGGPYQDASGADHADNHMRFGLLSRVAAQLSCEDSPLKWRAQVLHANDWQTGLAAAYLHHWGPRERAGTVFSIHNIAYQGLFPKKVVAPLGFDWSLFGMDGFEFWDQLSFLKSGLVFSDKIATVSRRYAKEIQAAPFGCGMEGVLAHRHADLCGILNGADYAVWNTATDPCLAQRFATADMVAGKAANKAALQSELGLVLDPEAPLLIIVSRLNDLKGMDLVPAVLPAILRLGGQLAVLGTGDAALEASFRAAALQSPGQVAARIGYSEELAHRLMAGGDMLVMPSRFEPCGLTQLYAFRYGTVPVAHAVGGLADTVVDAGYDSLLNGTATGFLFEHTNPGAFQWSLERAIDLFRRKEDWRRLQGAAAAGDFGWDRSAECYQDLYQSVLPHHDGKTRRPV